MKKASLASLFGLLLVVRPGAGRAAEPPDPFAPPSDANGRPSGDHF
jgi:hypothetical protein